MLILGRKISFLLLAAAMLLASCSPAPSSSGEATPSPLSTPIELAPCHLGSEAAQCGTLRVYENRAARSGRMISLRVAVIKAKSANPAPDPIFYLAGGPGDAATEDGTRQQFPYSLSENHDLVFVDQRGTGASNRVVSPTDVPDVSRMTPAEMDAALKAWVAKFLSSIDMDPQYYTTSVAMDDLDEVRQALGYDKINLYGYSYGATAAQYYLRQHEEHVRTVFLGGGSRLDIPVFARYALNGQRALDGVFALCQADANCQAAYPNLGEEFKSLLARLAEKPATDSFTNSAEQPETITYTPDYLAPVIRMMTKDSQHVPGLPRLIHRAYQEDDWKGFTNFIIDHGNYEWWGNLLMAQVIRCGEKWAAYNLNEVARLGEGSYLKGFDLWLAQNQAISCQYIPRGAVPEGTAPQTGSQVPVLILNGELDPIDPPDNMAGAEALFPNSAAVVLPYAGHSISDNTTIGCMWSIEDEFFQSGSVEGLHTECLKSIQPPVFVTSE